MTGVNPALREMVERELVERHRDARRVADDVAEARAGHARCALHVEAADLRVLPRLGKRGGLADATQLLRVVLRVAVGCRWMRWVRHQRERRISRSLGGRKLLLRLLERRLDGPQCLELLRCRLALELHAPSELVDLGDERAPALVGLEERVELRRRALARERGAPAVGVAAGSLQVDHESESVESAGRYLPATDETYAATSARCWSVRLVPKDGMPP